MATKRGYQMKRKPSLEQVWSKDGERRKVDYVGPEWIGFWFGREGDLWTHRKFVTVRQWDAWSAKAVVV